MEQTTHPLFEMWPVAHDAKPTHIVTQTEFSVHFLIIHDQQLIDSECTILNEQI